MVRILHGHRVSEACQINDLDHGRLHKPVAAVVSEACQINDLDHGLAFGERAEFVSEACQINDLDHVDHAAKTLH